MSYRKQLIESVNELQNIREEIFSQILNLSMLREMNDVDKAFDVGEVYDFDIKHFEDSKDVNVIELLKAFKSIEKAIGTLINLNVISDEELNFD
jgi:hypothetical protein